MSNVEALEAGSVDDALLKMRQAHTDERITFLAAVVLDANGNFRAFQGGDCPVVAAVGMLEILKARVTVDAMGFGGDD